ncbi:MAG: stage III sporulation protein AD [Clostridia bacterium]|jgi:stage III sporulation protein AD|nr:stage III sporulation protein AD [Clostridia bacterium]
MEILKICFVGIITAFCVVILKENKSDLAIVTGIAGGCIILLMTIDYISGIFSVLASLIEKAGINNDIFKILVKIIGIGYLVDFSAGIIEDAGAKSVSEKVILAGKVLIMAMSLPILVKLFEIIESIL